MSLMQYSAGMDACRIAERLQNLGPKMVGHVACAHFLAAQVCVMTLNPGAKPLSLLYKFELYQGHNSARVMLYHNRRGFDAGRIFCLCHQRTFATEL